MARTRAATYDDQRALILDRAAELFARRGYSAASMSHVAAACAMSKATLYHYFSDKTALLARITRAHVETLEAQVAEVLSRRLAPGGELQALVDAFMRTYASAQHEHRVLTEDMKFLPEGERAAVTAGQKRVVAAFAATIGRLRPALAPQATPLAMLLFGMINWTFTWLRPGGALTHAELAPMVTQLFLGGLPAVQAPPTQRRRRLPAPASTTPRLQETTT
jgi:AcrR family transcriptional regulator